MHEWGDSGITAVLWAIVVAVVLGFGVVHQARARASRYQEIRRLQAAAAEEARREEAESHAEYTSMLANRNYCAVCSNATTTRCSRCKIARYCSAACQVLHWNQGHKQECRAPDPVPSPSSSNGSRNFSEVFSRSSNSSGTLSDVSDVHSVDDAAPSELPKTTPLVTGNGTILSPRQILFPYEYFVKLFNWERLKVPPCGLINCGNSCFANVVLQCLTYTRPLTAYLLEGSHGEECRRSEWCFMCELQDHVWRVRQSQNPFSPIRILSRIRNIGNHLGYGRQEDAHEFMRFAIDSMQSICLDEAGGEKSVDPRSQETTFIHHIFGGHLQSQVKCMQCLHESNRYENMMDMAVEIHGCVETLEDALTQFTAPEWLDGENKYKCDRCNAYVKARKRLTVHEAPNILTIALKRFQSGKFGKLNKRVTFPEVLDVSPYMSAKGDKPPLYRLYAVVVHVDMLNASFFGHYICYVKDSQGLWYKIDDSKVKEVELEKVMAQRAYMLFYTRSFARPPPPADGATLCYPVEGNPELGRVGSERLGGLKVFPAPQYLRSHEILAGGAQGLHAMVDFNQMLADVEGSPETILEEHALCNGEIAKPHPSSWEIDRSTSIDDEISAEDSGCIASSSSLTQTSPYMSSFTSDHGVWFPSQNFVCQVPGSSTVEGAEVGTWDQKSSLPNDFSEVGLQPCAMDQPCTPKTGKRRLEAGLSPLPIPKPLDTDQLPAWPAGNLGRSIPGPPVLHSANLMSSSTSDESYSSWQTIDLQQSGEPSATFRVQHRVSNDQIYLPVVGESGQEPERTDYILVETIGTEEDEITGRAKRQHVEIDSAVDPQSIVQRLDEASPAREHSEPFELGERDMDCDLSDQHPGSLTSGAIFGPLVDPSEEDLSSSLGQVLLKQQATVASLLPLESDAVGSPPPGNETGGVDVCQESTCEQSGTTLQISARANIISTTGRAGCPTSPVCSGDDSKNSDPGSLRNSAGEMQEESIVTVVSSGAIQPLSPSHNELRDTVLEIAACYSGLVGQDRASPSMDSEFPLEKGVVNPVSDTGNGKEHGSVLDCPAMTGQTDDGSVPVSNGQVLSEPNKPPPQRLPKSRSTSKPLFAPGFLNRVPTPVPNSEAKLCSSTSSKTSSLEENGHVNNLEDQVREDATDPPAIDQHCSANGASSHGVVREVPEVDQPCSPDGVSHAAVNGHSATATSVTRTTCGNCTSGELCNSAHLDDHFENGHGAESGLVLGMQDNHLAKIAIESDQEPSSGRVKGASKRHSLVNGNGSSLSTPQVDPGVQISVEPVRQTVAPLGRPANGKLKQGRNETCNCGSQRKWKKCCGKSGVLKPEPGRRRLVV